MQLKLLLSRHTYLAASLIRRPRLRPQAEPCHHPAGQAVCHKRGPRPSRATRLCMPPTPSQEPHATHSAPAFSRKEPQTWLENKFFLKSSPICVGPRPSLCRAPALSVPGPTLCVSVPGALRVASCPALSASGPCVGPCRSLCRAVALSVSGPRALCVGPRLSVSGPSALCVGPRRSLRGAPALFMSGPGAASCSAYKRVLYCRYVSLRLKFRIKTLINISIEIFLLQNLAVCVGPRHSLCRALALSVSGPGALCVGPRRFLCRALALHHVQLTNVYFIAGMCHCD